MMMMMMMESSWSLFVLASLIKLLVVPAYRSTDFEVHRNWLAITSSLPIDQWYLNSVSEWTLDYPPFFAWFEFLLSRIAYFIEPTMLEVVPHYDPSFAAILFQRSTVIFSDGLLFYAIHRIVSTLYPPSPSNKRKDDSLWMFDPSLYKHHTSSIVAILIVFNPGLFTVDHIHFQYNGMLTGIQLLSMDLLIRDRCVIGAALFAILLNFKHIYMYMAPVYFVYLFRHYCFVDFASRFSFGRFLGIGAVVAIVFAVSLGPFFAVGQLLQLIARLFPFGRGLSHAYWAPNFWSFYNFLDRSLASLTRRANPDGVMLTGGLVGSPSQAHVVLPSVMPIHTLILTVLAILPLLYAVWTASRRLNSINDKARFLILSISISSLSFFMFGWHVHEKAILMVTVPLTLVIGLERNLVGQWFFLSTVGHFSLFPLLFTPLESTLKAALFVAHSSLACFFLGSSIGLSRVEWVYLLGFIPLWVFAEVVHPLILVRHWTIFARLAFLPLMIISGYSAIGVTVSYIKLYRLVMRK